MVAGRELSLLWHYFHRRFDPSGVGQTRSELVVDLKDLCRYSLTLVGAWSGLAPDGSSLFVRDLSTDEIFSLDLELP